MIGVFFYPKSGRREMDGWTDGRMDGSRVSPLRLAAILPNYRQPLRA